MSVTRRDFIKQTAIAATASVAGVSLPTDANFVTDSEVTKLKWSKAPCRFCGTGCGVTVAVATTRWWPPRATRLRGQQGPELREGLLPVQDHVWAGPADKPLLRMKNGKYDKNGEFAPVSWDRAFDEMEPSSSACSRRRARPPWACSAPASGRSGKATPPPSCEGRLPLQQHRPNARHCMASAVTGFMRTFGMDEPMGCYDDIEAADAFVLWGSNMAEMHPILWTRITDRRLSHPKTRVAVLSTFTHRSFDLADIPVIFKPQTDLAILNYIANHIIRTNKVNKDFVNKHTVFKEGVTDIGYGLRPDNPLQKAAKNAGNPNDAKPITFDEFAKFVSKYDADYVSKLSGVPKKQLEQLAELYADPNLKVMSLWTMGFNQHTRGTWVNNMVYNVHLLTGKIATPGNSPFSLTGQPSACGTARRWARSRTACRPTWWSPTPSTARKPSASGSCRPAPSPTSPATTPCCRTACSRTASSMPTGCRSTTTCRPRQHDAGDLPGYRNPTTSSSSPTPTRRSRRWPPT
jgi:nitrate reductase NapA